MPKIKVMIHFLLFLFFYFLLNSLSLLTFLFQNHTTPIMSHRYDSSADADEDGVPDFEEIKENTSPYLYDSDLDGLGDGEEKYIYFTNPLAKDTDLDGLWDGAEIRLRQNPRQRNKLSTYTYSLQKGSYSFILRGDGNFSSFVRAFSPFQDDVIALYSNSPFESGDLIVNTPDVHRKKLYRWHKDRWILLSEQKRIDSTHLSAPIEQYGFFIASENLPSPIVTEKMYDSGFLPEQNSFSFPNPQGSFFPEKNGLCFGVVTTAKLQYEKQLLPAQKQGVFPYAIHLVFPLYHATFTQYESAIRHWFWKQSNFFWFTSHFNFIHSNLQDLENMKTQLHDKKTVVFGLNHMYHDLPQGHAVLGYAAKEDLLSGELEIFLYDPNFPYLVNSPDITKLYKQNLVLKLTPYPSLGNAFYTFAYQPFRSIDMPPFLYIPDYGWSSSDKQGNFYFSKENFTR